MENNKKQTGRESTRKRTDWHRVSFLMAFSPEDRPGFGGGAPKFLYRIQSSKGQTLGDQRCWKLRKEVSERKQPVKTTCKDKYINIYKALLPTCLQYCCLQITEILKL